MIKTITVTNYLGDSIILELARPEQSGFLIKSINGLGPAKADINTAEVSTNDGSLFNSTRLNERNITMKIKFMETWKTDINGYNVIKENIEDIRQKTYKYFPTKREVNLKIETDNRTVVTSGYVESNEPDIFSKNEGCSISILCPDPYFYSDFDINTVFYGIEDMFEFPFENNSLTENLIEFGLIINKMENVINYKGDAEIGINITIHATDEASNIIIYNTGTREKMFINTDKLAELTGSGLVEGDTIRISTSKGNKRIILFRDGVSTNILNCLSKDADWFTLAKGDNIFAYTAETGSSNLQFNINNKLIYEGI